MARIYISGPITGVNNFGFNFSEAERKLQEKGHEVINPTKVELLLPKGTYEEYMKVDMLLLDMCDTIYMLKGWEKSCGANREYGYALAKDYIVLQQE